MIHYRSPYVTVFQSALYQTNSTVIETEEAIIVIDPTWLPAEVATIHTYVESIRKERAVYVIYTHADFDHILGCGAFNDAKMIGSEAMNELKDKQERIEQILQFDGENYLVRNEPVAFPELHHVINKHGEVLQIGHTKLTFYLTPGHTHDGLACVIEPLGILIAGDYLSDVEFPFIEDSVAYERTLRTFSHLLFDHEMKLLIPGHGSVTTERKKMKERIQQSQQYIEKVREDIQNKQDEMCEEIKKKWQFYRGLLPEHASNRKVIAKELAIKEKGNDKL